MTSEQPKPKTNHHPASWGLVQDDLQARGEHEVLGDIAERHLMGMAKYGTPLQPFNGRDSLQDAREESMDLVVYLKNVQQELPPVVPPGIEHRMVSRMYHTALGLMCALKDYQVWKANQSEARQAESFQKAREEFEKVKYGKVKPVQGPIYSERYPAPPNVVFRKRLGEFADVAPITEEDIQARKPQEAPQVSPGPIYHPYVQEAHLGHPGNPQGISVEVANQVPIVFIPDQIHGQLRDELEEWKRNMEISMEAERQKYLDEQCESKNSSEKIL